MSNFSENKKAVVFSLGCKVNQYESASLMNRLAEMGYLVTDELVPADLYIINTCAVTGEAEKKSRQAIARVKKLSPKAKIVVVGCASEKNAERFTEKPDVFLVGGAKAKNEILSFLSSGGSHVVSEVSEYEDYLPAKPTTTRAFIKIQDGCNNFCSYCIIPYLRGRSRSRAPQNIIEELSALSASEVVLTGIDLSDYNYDGTNLGGLLSLLVDVKKRIRLGSLEVSAITDELLIAARGLYDFAPHFHLSLQSGSNAVLKKMNRKYTREKFMAAVDKIREYFPKAAITTDIITSFPTESEEDFLDTIDLVKRVKFADIHCFIYSRRSGTVAAKLKEQSEETKKRRQEQLLRIKEECIKEYIDCFIGSELEFIPEEYVSGETVGYTENYIRVYVPQKLDLNGIVRVKLTSRKGDGAVALLI